MDRKRLVAVVIILIVVIILAVTGGVFYYETHKPVSSLSVLSLTQTNSITTNTSSISVAASSTITQTWPCISEPITQLSFCTPFATSSVQLVVATDTAGDAGIDFQLQNPTSSSATARQFVSEFMIGVYPNLQHLTLMQWFERDIDVRGMLAASDTFMPQTLSDGATALVMTNLPLPSSWFNATDTGPVDIDALRLLPPANQVITIGRSQVWNLSAYGYSNDAQMGELELQVLGTIKATN